MLNTHTESVGRAGGWVGARLLCKQIKAQNCWHCQELE